MEIQRLMDNLIASADWEEATHHSYRNFHAGGLHYVNLLRHPRLTAKLYVFKHVKMNSRGYLVWPHNHAYNFTHRTLVGEIVNVKFRLTGGDDWTLYTFDTPLNGGDGLSPVTKCGLEETDRKLLAPGESYYLTHEEIHTLRVHQDYAAALLLQFHDQRGQTTMYAPVDEEPDCENKLYQKMESYQARQLVEEFREHLNGGGDAEHAEAF